MGIGARRHLALGERFSFGTDGYGVGGTTSGGVDITTITACRVSLSRVNLRWTCNLLVDKYIILRNGIIYAETNTHHWTDTTVAVGGIYVYEVYGEFADTSTTASIKAPFVEIVTPLLLSERKVWLQPYDISSVWNLPVSDDAIYEPEAGPLTTAIRDTGYTAWVNYKDYSHSLNYSVATDPVAEVYDSNHSFQSYYYNVPIDAHISLGTDAHMHVLSPDQHTIHEGFHVDRNSNIHYTARRCETIDAYGSGIGPQNGVRAYGGSAMGGIVRAWEVDSNHPDYTGEINHAISLMLDAGQMFYDAVATGSDKWGYDSNGYGKAKGYVWPATEQDYNSPNLYTGVVPMGTYVVLDKNVDISTLGLSWAGLMLAKAYQDYGGYVTDITVGSFVVASIEPTVRKGEAGYAPDQFRSALVNSPALNALDIKAIRSHLRVVTNNSVTSPNGGTLGSARRQPLALPLA